MRRDKRFLFLVRRSPAEGILMAEALDSILTAAAFDLPVRVLFLDNGVFQLVAQPPSGVAEGEAATSLLRAFELYDVREVAVEQESLAARGLADADLLISAKRVPRAMLPGLWSQHDILVSC